MTGITRRRVLTGAGAAAVVAGVPGAVQAKSDPQIEALVGQLGAAQGQRDDIHARTRAALGLIPKAIREAYDASPFGPLHCPDYYREYVASGAEALDERSDQLCDKVADIRAQIIQTPATTLRGTLSKARVAWHVTAASDGLDETDPDFGNCCPLDDPVFIWSILQDLERLAGEAGS